jgi:hypothetical protein
VAPLEPTATTMPRLILRGNVVPPGWRAGFDHGSRDGTDSRVHPPPRRVTKLRPRLPAEMDADDAAPRAR